MDSCTTSTAMAPWPRCAATVDMGAPVLDPRAVPAQLAPNAEFDGRPFASDVPIPSPFGDFAFTCISMGNPHATVFVPSADKAPVEELGPRLENDPLFPEKVNVGFVEVIDSHTLKARIWERGSGETMACGTGTCAAVVAATLNGYCPKGEDVRVILNGGELMINYTDERVLMTGEAVKVYDGQVEV